MKSLVVNSRVVVCVFPLFTFFFLLLLFPWIAFDVASGSPDFESVADYYSGELVALVRRVLEVIPVSIFRILREIIKILSHELAPLPLKLEVVRLKDASQLDKREQLAKHTHRISVFAEGILAMEETKLGMIEINPREILEDGIRKELGE